MRKVEPIRSIASILGQPERRAELAVLIDQRNSARSTLAEINAALRAAKDHKRETEARLRDARRKLSAAMKAYSGPEPKAAPEQPSSATRHMGGQSWDFRTRIVQDDYGNLVPESEPEQDTAVSLASLPPLGELLQAESEALKDDYAATISLGALEASQAEASRTAARTGAAVEAVAKEIIKAEIRHLHHEAMKVHEDLIRRRAVLKQLVDLTTDRFRPKGDALIEEAASYLRVTFLDDNDPAGLVWREAFKGLLDDANTELPQ